MIGYLVAGLALAAALAVVLHSRRQTARTLQRLSRMFAAAQAGRFQDTVFDESKLSSLESQVHQYLWASALSAENLERQKNQLASFLSDISHQVKTPAANLQLYAQLLQEQPLNEPARVCVQAIAAQSEKLSGLMEALTKSSRLETGLLVLHPQPGQLREMVCQAMAQFQPRAQAKGIRLTLAPGQAQACFDRKWTEEALCNLLDNALKYTPAQGQVTVTLRQYQLFSAIQVTDTGPGIPEQEQARIFSRFYRGQAHQQEEGVGIGLHLTRQIAQQQGGYVKLTSVPGQGSTFSLYLPREAGPL